MDTAFPKLRDELNIYPSSRLQNGAPSYTLHDPVSNAYYKLGWLEFEVIKRWLLGSSERIVNSTSQETTLSPSSKDVDNILSFLSQNNLLNVAGKEATQDLIAKKQMRKSEPLTWLIKNYLFFRVPLVRPDRFLTVLYASIHRLFNFFVLKVIIIAAGVGAFLVLREWPDFLSGFKVLQTPQGIIIGFAVLTFAKVVHELGHGLASKHFGCRVPSMGVAFIVMWPLLWTDTTEGWKLKDNRKRLLIDSGGMIAELSLAAIASILWVLSSDGAFKMTMHLLASTSWIMTLAVNLNPFMRFDGYYILADATDKPNLQQRSFDFGRWKFRQLLLGIKVPPPEQLGTKNQNWMILYAYGTWLYRFFLFLGIALLVYHLFFKALGITLMVIELWWFIGKPIINEVKQLKSSAKNTKAKKRFVLYYALLAAFVVFIAVPLPHKINATAIMIAKKETPLIVPLSAQLASRNVDNQTPVKKGDLLFKMASPSLENEIESTRAFLASVKTEQLQNAANATTFSRSNLNRKDVARLVSELVRLQRENESLAIRAAYDGVVRDISRETVSGVWLRKKENLAILTSHETKIQAFVRETDVHRVKPGSSVQFLSDDSSISIQGKILSISINAIKTLPKPELADIYGGPIAVKQRAEIEKLLPEQKLYGVEIEVEDIGPIRQSLLGVATINAERSSFGLDMAKKLYSIIIRESGL